MSTLVMRSRRGRLLHAFHVSGNKHPGSPLCGGRGSGWIVEPDCLPTCVLCLQILTTN